MEPRHMTKRKKKKIVLWAHVRIESNDEKTHVPHIP